MELKRVVVTGMGAITPIGNSVVETWNNALNGANGLLLLLILILKNLKLNSRVK